MKSVVTEQENPILASIVKSGYDLRSLDRPGDSSFGGLYEVVGLARDLSVAGFRVERALPTQFDTVVFEFGSAPKAEQSPERIEGRCIVPCVTDLSLLAHLRRDNIVGILTQVPHWASYFPFQTYVLDYLEWSEPSFEEWLRRPYRSVYGGGSRYGRRSRKHSEYLAGNMDIATVYSSARELAGFPQVQEKIPHRLLVEKYREARFGIVFGDPWYEALGVVTQRPYEYMCCGMIPIFDEAYNASAVLSDAAIRVNNRERLREVMDRLETDYHWYQNLRESIADALRDDRPGRRRFQMLQELSQRLKMKRQRRGV